MHHIETLKKIGNASASAAWPPPKDLPPIRHNDSGGVKNTFIHVCFFLLIVDKSDFERNNGSAMGLR